MRASLQKILRATGKNPHTCWFEWASKRGALDLNFSAWSYRL